MARLEAAYSARIVNSIRDVREEDWDSLAKDCGVASHGWYRTFEEEFPGGVEPCYVLLSRRDSLIAATACFKCRPDGRLFNLDEFMFGRFGRLPRLLHLSFSPALVIAPHGLYGYQPAVLLEKTLTTDDRLRASRMLLDCVEGLARQERLALHLPYLQTEFEPEVTQLLSERHYLATRAFPVCFLDIQWDSFDGYLDHLSSFSTKMKKNVREEIRRFQRAGFTIEIIENPSSCRDRLFELADRHYRFYNDRGVALTPEFFPALKRHLGEEATFYGAYREESLTGFVVLVRRGKAGYLPWTGIDRDSATSQGVYFNLVFYHPIENALELGIRKLYFGRALYRTKVRRGCGVYGPLHFYRGPSRLSEFVLQLWFAFHRWWMIRKMGEASDLEDLRYFGTSRKRR